ncbi:MAG: hypothetical protein R3A80_05745 [Bdellovibrionota bacterium]
MLAASIKRNPKSGQALIEFLPAIILFFVVIGASLVFFIGLRESFHMQIAARNAIFAKIRNSGPLVTPAAALNYNGHYMFPFTSVGQAGLSPSSTCISVRPQSGVTEAVLPSIMGLSLNLKRAHRATIFRRPGPVNRCD